MTEISGAAQLLVRRLALRYAGTGRAVISGVVGTLGIVAAPRWWPAAAICGAAVCWSLAYGRRLARDRPPPWLVAADLAVVTGACLTQRWTVPADALASNQGWVVALASIVVVTCQWHTGGPAGTALVAIVDGAFLGGILLTGHLAGGLTMVIWLPVEAALSRLLWLLVRRGAARADGLTARAEQARRAAAVAEAVRADERAHAAMLHDTAASTLLMIGLGGETGPWLRDQAKRDLSSLREWAAPEDGEKDLIPVLREVIAGARLEITATMPDSVNVPATAAAALCGATREALTNVARHAGTREARVAVEVDGDRVVIEVTDQGAGFTPREVPPGRYGVAGSIVGRLESAGGRAEVSSAPGQGTRVRLAWP